MACCHNNPLLHLPITIGSYPIQDINPGYSIDHPHPNNFQSDNVISQQPSAPHIPDQGNFSTLPYSNGTPSAPFQLPNDGKIKYIRFSMNQFQNTFPFIQIHQPTRKLFMHGAETVETSNQSIQCSNAPLHTQVATENIHTSSPILSIFNRMTRA